MELPETVEVATGESVLGSVIWLHGLGADGHDFEPIVPQLDLPADLPLRFVFPHAPVRPVTLNGGMAMRAWYDIYSIDRDGPIDEDGIRESAATLRTLIEREHARGVPYEKIVIAGFSQGGAIASYTGLAYPERLAGVMVLSAYLPLQSALAVELDQGQPPRPKDLRIFMAHGTFDPMLPFQLGTHSRDAIQALGFSIEWHEYPMPHAVCPEEIADISRWLTRCYRSSE